MSLFASFPSWLLQLQQPMISTMLSLLWMATKYVLFSLTALVASFLVQRYISWLTSPLRQLPGPKWRGLPWHNFATIRREPYLQPFYRWWNEAANKTASGDLTKVPLLHYNMVFWRQAVLILDKDVVKQILTSKFGKDPPRFTKRTQFIRDTVGCGLVAVQGTEWARHRRLLQPAFNTQFVRRALAQAVPPRVRRLVQCWAKAAQGQWELDLASHLSVLTLDIVGDVAFSHNFHALNAMEAWAQDDNDNNKDRPLSDYDTNDDELLKYFTNSLRINFRTIFCVLVGLEQLNWWINPEVRTTWHFLDRAVERVVAKAARQSSNHDNNTVEQPQQRSLLHILLQNSQQTDENETKLNGNDNSNETNKETKEAEDDDDDKEPLHKRPGTSFQLSEQDIKDEVKTFMIAGYETTSAWLRWAVFAMTQHDGVQDKLWENVQTHAPSNSNEAITPQHIDQMDYLGAFLQEVLRFYPPVGLFIRYNKNAETFHGVTFPPDTRLILSPHLLGRHPKYWDEPNQFRPERWINVSDQEAERRRFAFLAFSAGGRNCIGQHFATMEAKLILAHLVREFKILLAPSLKDVEFVVTLSGVTARTKPALKVIVQSRRRRQQQQ